MEGGMTRQLPSKGLLQTEALYQYVLETSVFPREPEPLKELRNLTTTHPRAMMATAPDSAQLISLLLKLINAKKTIEVGFFTGYSLLLTALSIPYEGKITEIDINRESYEIGLPVIRKAGVERKVDFVESEALPVLDKLLVQEGSEGSYDFAYVDANKGNYWNYHEKLMKLVRVGGVIAYDNTLWGGSVAMPAAADSITPGGQGAHYPVQQIALCRSSCRYFTHSAGGWNHHLPQNLLIECSGLLINGNIQCNRKRVRSL